MSTDQWLALELLAGLAMAAWCRRDAWRLGGLLMAGLAALCLLGWVGP
ncbi:hypothetical protein ACIQTN_29735 [Streptomyces werraensis]